MVTAIGALLFVLGACITVYNVYASFLHYPLHRLRGESRENYTWDSGLPILGSLLLWASMPFFHAFPEWIWIAFITSMFDTKGLHWFAVGMLWLWWSDRRESKV